MTANTRQLRVVLAKPRGFCAGVDRAIEVVEKALHIYGPPIYVRHEIVHNNTVVARLTALGAVFVNEVDDVPSGAVAIFSAHGVSRMVERAAAGRRLEVIDATCPLVQKVHNQGRRYAALGYDVIIIGHAGHAEVEGTRGQIEGRVHVVGNLADIAALSVADPRRVAYVTQTTLSVNDTRELIAALTRRYPAVVGPETSDICYATQNRQNAVRELAQVAQLLLVMGSSTSSNSSRLREIGESLGLPSHLLDQPRDIDPAWLDGIDCVGLTAGASAPESLVQESIAVLRGFRAVTVETLDGVEENVRFRLPPELLAAERVLVRRDSA